MSAIHPFLFLIIAEFALFVVLLLAASLWSGTGAMPKPGATRAVTSARSPTGLRHIERG
ncbi:hypothetical protein [Phenylobacterium kunshanense]|uniref:hypothetical protein n=1 Tax=Phenylobacterium kunshanense TaxID=1445034 RepID=UPI001403F70E|nr:hypothetical protein [Phenylobacterium kunshanense]